MGNRAKASTIAAAVRIALLSTSPWFAAHAATLPIPCSTGTCVNLSGVPASASGLPFATYGSASWALSGSTLTVNQTSANAILNWLSFNISKDGTVNFVQPSSASVALNEIYDSNPTQILGALNANGHIFLINQNGIIFGAGAQVNVGGLVASTLPITSGAAVTTGPDANYSGLTAPELQGSGSATGPTFQAANGVNSGNITVQQGATLEAADGGQIFLFAPNVTNLGTIQTPGGQTVLAAGSAVYLAASGDPNLRGVVVEVQGTGTVRNGLASNSNVSSPAQLVGQIIAQDGNISLAAVAVNQYGRVNATTSVTENGSIYLQARQGTIFVQQGSTTPYDEPSSGGTLTLGQNSDTEVTLDTTDPTETVDSVAQLPSTILMSGKEIDMLQGSVARATGGVVDVYADSSFAPTAYTGGLDDQLGTSNWDKGLVLGNESPSDGSRFYMAPNAVIDVSGANITLPVSDTVISAKLEATELADSPLLRNGPLQGQTIYFDVNAQGTNADGSNWWGTPVANVTGEILGITRNVVERNLDGGTVNIQSQGDVVLAPSSTIDISGGYIQYTGGYIDTSELLTPWGQTIPVASASPDIPYLGVDNSTTTTDAKWGVTSTYQANTSYYSPGYIEGKDAGTLSLAATAFILDGTVSASTVVGPYQTQPTTPKPTASYDPASWVQETTSSGTEYSMYRPFDQVPAGGTLQIGTPGVAISGDANDLLVDTNITIATGQVLDGLKNADGSAFDPLTDPLPADFTNSILQPSFLDAFQNISVYTNAKLVEPAGVALSLAPGGSFTAQAASIDIEGGIDVPQGTISLTAQPTYTDESNPSTTLTLGAAASLTATGEWVNDSSVLYPNGNSAPVYIDGGTISLTASNPNYLAAAQLLLEPGSLIDVSGGAQLTSSGSLNAGTAGTININASTASVQGDLLAGAPAPASELELGATLRGYGLYEGGSLSISAAGVCIAASDCSNGDLTVVWLTPQFFDSGGFGSYSVTGGQNGLSIAPGMDLQLVQQNLQLPSGYAMMPDAATLVGLTTTTVLPLQVRDPVDLTLALYYPANLSVNTGGGSSNYNQALSDISSLPSLLLPQGDVITTDPGGSLSLTSDTRLDIEGTLRAPGGEISLTVNLPSDTFDASYDPTQGIWLGPDAVLDASGAAEIFPNSMGNPTGSVLPGGTVNLTADAGYVELLPGSVIDVSGTSGLIDASPVGGGLLLAQEFASAGGTIDLTSADGAVLGGTLLAAAGTAGRGANQPAGGSLYVTEDPTLVISPGAGVTVGAPTSDIQVIPALSPTIVEPGAAVPDALEGLTLLPTNTLAHAGFSVIALTSRAVDTELGADYGGGEIEFSGGASLTASDEVSLDAPIYTVDAGTTASIEAPYVEFGDSDSSPPYVPNITSGTGVLNVSGGFIELYGTSELQGIGTANFDSSGDLRLRGIQYAEGVAAINGELYADGTLNLTAQQIYPTTLTQFVISTDPSFDPATISESSQPTSGSIVIQGSEGTNTDVLSAGGSLTLVAGSITQDGVLRAPFGTIALDATSLTLGSGSLTSTSADGLTIPFGNTQGNTQGGAQSNYDWIYSLADITVVYGTDGQAPPSQNIELNAANVNVQSNAVIDISGGGDLQASEWIQGPGGSQDLLDDCNDCYAIIPSLHTSVAPYDPAIVAASTNKNLQELTNLQLGDAVYLSAGSGVPAGTYVLLPAAYALLPGAYLVTPMTGTTYRDMQPGQTLTAPDGGTIVSGYLTGMGLSTGSSRLNGFDVTPASIYLNEAQYALTTGNQFFSGQEAALAATASAANEAVSAMRLPQDAGVVDIAAYSFLSLDGTLHAAAAQSDARGGEVDISNPDIIVAASATGVSQSGALVLTTSSLDQLGAQTLLLGGTDSDGTITTAAQTITVLSGASLSAPQLLLTAQQQISVQGGASISATGTGPPSGATYSLSDTGAFLGVSTGPQITVAAATGGSNPQGDLNLAAASSLNAGKGSAYLYATAGITTSGSIALSGGSLAVQAPAIALGNASNTSGVALLGANVLGDGSLANLLLVSSNGIAIADGASASAQNITIDAPGLVSQLASGQTASLSATGTLSLTNSQGTSITSNGLQGGSVTLTAADVILGSDQPGASSTQSSASSATPSTFAINGFGSVALDAQQTLTADSNISFSTDNDLAITASSVTTAAGISASLAASGTLTILSPSGPAAPSAAAALGGQLDITAASIVLGTQLALPSGNVTLDATAGDITLNSGGAIDVAGVDQVFDTDTVATPGGIVQLSAPSGSITAASGSSIDVSAGAGGMGGSLSISAPTGSVTEQGTLAGTGAQQGASFSVDAGDFGQGGFSALSAAVAAGGFAGTQSYRLQGPSDGGPSGNDDSIVVSSTLMAQNVLLEADSGTVTVNGTIDASGSSGGSVTLAAANGIVVTGDIDANATTLGGSGGTVELDVENGVTTPLTLGNAALINVSGGGVGESEAGPGATAVLAGTGGTVLMRVPYSSVSGVSFGPFAPNKGIEGASSEILEGYEQVSDAGETDSSGNVDIVGTEFGNWETDAQAIMTSDLPAVSALNSENSASGLNVILEPGIEIDATGNITLDTPWNLNQSQWQFQEGTNGPMVPGILTLRAGGSVTFDDSLSDGFKNATAGKLSTETSSWSYRIVAGADLGKAGTADVGAANPLAVTTNPTQPPGDVTIGNGSAGAFVRTGTGFIEVAASGNLVLTNLGSVLYTGGALDTLDPAATTPTNCDGLCPQLPSYSLGGGNVTVDVAGSVEGAPGTNQFVNDWLWRQGGETVVGTSAATAWAVQFNQFDLGDGIATLGGGNVTIHAGGDIQNLSASVASIGVASGGGVDVKDGGNLTVSAGGSLLGGLYYAGLGNATLSAGDAVGIGTGQAKPVSPLIALGEASVTITARGDVQISGIVNPTLLNSSGSDDVAGTGTPTENYFSTYGSASATNLMSIGGNINLDDESGNMEAEYASTLTGNAFGSTGQEYLINGSPAPLYLVSPSLTVASLSGDVNLDRVVYSFPSSQGDVKVFAAQNITFLSGKLVMPDVAPTALPSIANPQQYVGSIVAAYPFSSSPIDSEEHGSSPLFESVSAFDENPVTLVASNGNLEMGIDPITGNVDSGIWSAKPVVLSAGQDIVDLVLTAQNISPGDVTSITAGGDIVYPQLRTSYGGIEAINAGITVAGPGQLQVSAGGNIELGTSAGITTIANQQNAALPSTGASISVEAGVGGSSATAAQYSAFISQYVDGSSQFDGQLVTYVEQITGQDGLTDAEAKQEFNTMAPEQQRTFLEQLFFDLLRTYGTEAADTGNNADFAGAYAAIQTLFPGANPNLAKGQTDPYSGSISLYFSQIYTEQGGSISLLAPGGEVNAGLALAPTSYGLSKAPNELGVVAEGVGDVNSFSYGDFQVNQSRVFAADGGNILVWSTEGNIDAGRGSKTSLSASAPLITYDLNAFPTVTYYAPTSGSGIQALADTPGATYGDVALFAPHGVINANEAGIVAGNLTVAATAVLGTNNITVTGTEVGVPVAVTGTGAQVVGASSSAAGALSSAQSNLGQQPSAQQQAPQAAAELRWLDVFVLGFGEQTCSASDIECLKRQKHTAH
jgi:filamentous hemagglutinin